jgi:hypothetical protein
MFVNRLLVNKQSRYYKKKLNKQLQYYKSDLRKYKNAFEFVKQLNYNEINEIHCDARHFKRLNTCIRYSKCIKVLDTGNIVPITLLPVIVPITMIEHWDMMKEEFANRINSIKFIVKSLRNVIKNNTFNELKQWVFKQIAWSDKLPNSILINYDYNDNIIKIKIAVENYMMIDDAHFCTCYVVDKSRNSDMWNLYGEYDANMYCFSPTGMQNKFANLNLTDSKL